MIRNLLYIMPTVGNRLRNATRMVQIRQELNEAAQSRYRQDIVEQPSPIKNLNIRTLVGMKLELRDLKNPKDLPVPVPMCT